MPVQDHSQRQSLPRRALALVLAGGHMDGHAGGQPELTDRLATTTVHFGGKFRTVDFALSNCLNSGIRRIGVITPYKSHSLQRHLHRAWDFLKNDASEFVALLPAQPGGDEAPRHCGTAGAVARNQATLDSHGAAYVVVLAGDHIYRMNYAVMLADHVAKGRECTVACMELPREGAGTQAAMRVDAQWHVTDWLDAPAAPPSAAGSAERALVSMGIYIFNASYLYAELARDSADATSSHDFARDIIPRAVRSGKAAAHPFSSSCVGTTPGGKPYWCDVNTIDSYWGANIELTASQPALDLYDPHWPIRTHQAQLAPAKFLHNEADRRGMAVESLVSGGSIISGSVLRSVLFSSVRVHSYASVEWSVLLPAVEVGRHARLRRVVVDRGCKIPDGLVVGEDAADDARCFQRTESGITWVTADMIARRASLAGLKPEAAVAGLP